MVTKPDKSEKQNEVVEQVPKPQSANDIGAFMLTEYEALKDAWIHNEERLDKAMDFLVTALSAGGAALVLLYQAVADATGFYLGTVIISAAVLVAAEVTRWRVHSAIVRYSVVSRSLNAIKAYFAQDDAKAQVGLYYWVHDDTYARHYPPEYLDVPAPLWFGTFRPYNYPVIMLNSALSFCLATSIVMLLNSLFQWGIQPLPTLALGALVAVVNYVRLWRSGVNYINAAVRASRNAMRESPRTKPADLCDASLGGSLS
jgi:hypothetical protein